MSSRPYKRVKPKNKNTVAVLKNNAYSYNQKYLVPTPSKLKKAKLIDEIVETQRLIYPMRLRDGKKKKKTRKRQKELIPEKEFERETARILSEDIGPKTPEMEEIEIPEQEEIIRGRKETKEEKKRRRKREEVEDLRNLEIQKKLSQMERENEERAKEFRKERKKWQKELEEQKTESIRINLEKEKEEKKEQNLLKVSIKTEDIFKFLEKEEISLKNETPVLVNIEKIKEKRDTVAYDNKLYHALRKYEERTTYLTRKLTFKSNEYHLFKSPIPRSIPIFLEGEELLYFGRRIILDDEVKFIIDENLKKMDRQEVLGSGKYLNFDKNTKKEILIHHKKILGLLKEKEKGESKTVYEKEINRQLEAQSKMLQRRKRQKTIIIPELEEINRTSSKKSSVFKTEIQPLRTQERIKKVTFGEDVKTTIKKKTKPRTKQISLPNPEPGKPSPPSTPPPRPDGPVVTGIEVSQFLMEDISRLMNVDSVYLLNEHNREKIRYRLEKLEEEKLPSYLIIDDKKLGISDIPLPLSIPVVEDINEKKVIYIGRLYALNPEYNFLDQKGQWHTELKLNFGGTNTRFIKEIMEANSKINSVSY